MRTRSRGGLATGAGFGWVDADARLIIVARALRGFAQGAVAILVAIYLGLRGFTLVETGLLLTCGSIGAAVTAIGVGLFGDTFGRRPTLLILSAVMTVTGLVFATSDSLVVWVLDIVSSV